MNRGITYRPTSPRERDWAFRRFRIDLAPGDSAVIIVDDEIVAFTDEYGTVSVVAERIKNSINELEKFAEFAAEIWGSCMKRPTNTRRNASRKFPGKWETWVSYDNGKSWTMVG